jgi:excisionase family DNA binding protein
MLLAGLIRPTQIALLLARKGAIAAGVTDGTAIRRNADHASSAAPVACKAMADIPFSRAAADRRRRFLTVAETADLLGLSHSTIQRATRAGDFPAIKIRGRYIVPAKALDQLEDAALEQGLVDTAEFGRRAPA